MIKTIGVLTSGGDAPGMNAAVRAVTRTAISRGIKVYGIRRGYNGLINGDIIEMNERSVSDILQKGGTCLYTARCPEFRTAEGVDKAVEKCKEIGLEGIVVIGGDGSFRGAADLSAKGILCIVLPGTIDNDIACTEYTIGYDTAMNTALDMVDKIRDTAQSHDRCSVVEVMGRNAGYIAVNTGIACGATEIITQRGGSPTLRDRVVASQMGHYAVELLEQGIGNRVVGMQAGKIVDFDIQEALSMKKPYEEELHQIAREIAI